MKTFLQVMDSRLLLCKSNSLATPSQLLSNYILFARLAKLPNSDSVFNKTLSQDLHAARISFEREDFSLMNILANRLMSDAQFMTGTNRRHANLAGVFLRDVAFEMTRVATLGKTAPVATAAAAVKSYVNTVCESATKGHLTAQQYWQVYDDYSDVVRKYGLSEAEQKAYSENKQFTRYATRYLLDFLSKEQELLFDSRNLLLEGILNETIRIYRVHGAGRDELIILTLLTYLQRIYNYIRYTQTAPDGKIKPDPVKSEILANIEKISALTSMNPIDLEKSTDILESLVISWREYYVRYMEPVTAPSSTAERGVELPTETKKKITEAITKELEKDTKTK